jgi:diguanylate cyclase (GGDEF)-like protein
MPTRDQLLEVIAIQGEVASLGLDLDLTRLLELVVRRTLALMDADGAAVEMAEGEDMVYRATAGMAEGSLGLRLKRSQSLSGLCVAQGESLRCDDALTDPRIDRAACQRLGLRSMVVVPLRHHGVSIGVLKAMSRQPRHFQDRHLTLLGMLSNLIAAALFFATRCTPGELFHKATHDGLTDLPNRSLFLDRLHASMGQATRDRQPLAVVMLDMNGLKPINDRLGHRAGDAALLEFSRRLAASVRQTDTPARLGGDEFGLLLRPVAADGGLDATLGRLAQRLNGSFDYEGRQLPVHASMGAASYPADGADAARLLELADQRMYAQKHARCAVTAA